RRADRARREEGQAGEGGSRALPAGRGPAEGGPGREESGGRSPAADRVGRAARSATGAREAGGTAAPLRRVPQGAGPGGAVPAGGRGRRDRSGRGKTGPGVLGLPRCGVREGGLAAARDSAGAQGKGGGANGRPPPRMDGTRFA